MSLQYQYKTCLHVSMLQPAILCKTLIQTIRKDDNLANVLRKLCSQT